MIWQSRSSTPPPDYRYGPAYRISREKMARAIFFILRGAPRSLARDGLLAIHDMPAPPLVRDADRIPEHGPFVVVANHYERPGLWMAWSALLLGSLVWMRTGTDTRWIAIEEWENFSFRGIPIPPRAVHTVFARAFHTYGILAMATSSASAAARAASMRAAAQTIKSGQIVGLMPEGNVGPTPELLPAREGVGSFLLLLAGSGASILPVGLHEEEERLVAQFGSLYQLQLPPALPKSERDAWVRHRVMRSIRDLLPEALWGAYRAES